MRFLPETLWVQGGQETAKKTDWDMFSRGCGAGEDRPMAPKFMSWNSGRLGKSSRCGGPGLGGGWGMGGVRDGISMMGTPEKIQSHGGWG